MLLSYLDIQMTLLVIIFFIINKIICYMHTYGLVLLLELLISNLIITETPLEMDLEIVCTRCHREYTDNNLPRTLIKCGHTFCQECLRSIGQLQQDKKIKLVCPEDNEEIEVGDVSQLTVNKALISIIQIKKNNISTRSINSIKDQSFNLQKINHSNHQDEDIKALTITINALPQAQFRNQRKTSQAQNQLCLLHNKQIEIVCLVDYQRLCSKCALFGQHRGHQFISLDQVDQGNKKIYESLLNIFDEKSNLLDKLTSKKRRDVLMSKLSSKANQLKKEISDKFKKMYDEINKAEQAAYHQLQQMVNGIQRKMKKLLVVDDRTAHSYESWALNAQKKFNFYQSGTHEGLLEFYLSGNNLIQSGKDIISQLKLQENKSNIQAQKFIQEIGVFFNQEPFLTSLPKIVQLYQNEKEYQRKITKAFNQKQNSKLIANCQFYEDIKKRVKTEAHEDDQSLLQLVDQFDHNSHSAISAKILDDQSFLNKTAKEQEKSTPTKMPKQAINNTPSSKVIRKKTLASTIGMNGNKQSIKESFKQSIKQQKPTRQQKKQAVISKEAVKKKMRSIKIPEKYEKMLQGVITDQIQAADFTNAQLGDAITLQICDILKTSTRIKSLKLIRNKITDQGFTKILPLLNGISVLNLSQNMLTQNCLNVLSDLRPNLPNLKTIILSQNKIAQRKCKGVVQKLRKMDLAISI